MTRTAFLLSRTFFFVITMAAFSLLPCRLSAQNLQYTNNTTDSNLRGSLQVDPSTLGMSFNLPMGAYGGRGATLPISLTYSSKLWRMQHHFGWQSGVSYFNQIKAQYAEKSISGWTSSTDVPYIEFTGASEVYDEFGGSACLGCSPGFTGNIAYVNRVLLHLPDGSTHELRKDDNIYYNTQPTLSGVYLAVDGSRIKYDASTSTIYLPDGARYWLTAPNGVQYIDRNGNTLTYNSTNKQWTDTLGRVINALALSNAATGDVTYQIPGVNGVNQQFILRWRRVGDAGVRTDSGQALRFKGDRNYGISNPLVLSPALFVSNGPDRVVDFGGAGNEFNPIVLHEIQLPNGSIYKFTYNVWGEVDKVLLPSGGYERFEYAEVPPLSDVTIPYSQTNRGVIKHWISATGNSGDEVLWTYASTGGTTTVTNPSGAKAQRVLHTGNGSNTYFGFEDARAGRAYEERTYNASNQMIRRTLTEWSQSGPLSGGYTTATRDPRPTKTVEILLDTTGDALAKTTTTQYDADLNAIVTNQYDYATLSQSAAQNYAIGSIPQGSLIRTEEMIYLVNDLTIPQYIRDAYRARHLLSLPTNSKVKNASGTVVAESQTLYDEAAYAPLTVAGTVPGWTNPNTTYRGQITTVRSWLNTNGTWLETHVQSDVLGNLRKAWDAKGNVSEIQYNDSFSDTSKNALNTYAYATKAITPVPDPSGVKGSSTALQSTTIYEYWTGRTISTTDVNLKTTSFEYEGVLGSGYNSLNRPTRIVRPDGGETLFEYGDTPLNFYERIRTKQNTTTWVETYNYLDGLSRSYRTATNEGSNSWSVKDTQYDTHGRAWKVSNPYRYNGTNPKLATPPANEWTTTTYDAINRVLTVTTPDNAVITSSYNGNKVTAIDQAGKQRKTETDALGRTINVWEAPNAENFQTTQTYDALSNLTQVNQGGQIRTFVYDSLKRLTQATDPESGTKTYTYDANGNVLTMTDARGITTSYTYDNLNRNTSVGYNSYPNGTSFTENYYDFSTNGKGRLRYNIAYNTLPNGNLIYSYNNVNTYDAMGRVTSYTQNFLINQGGYTWKPFTTTRTYDLAGNVTAQTHPSNRVTNYSYDTAGRLTNFNGTLGDGASRTYADQMAYNAAGQMTKERFGTNTLLYHNLHYNIRQQLYDSRLGTNSGDEFTWNRGALQFFYSSNQVWGGSGTDNNGNVFRADHWRPLNDSTSTWYTAYTYYGYDNLNRIQSTSEYYNSSANGTTQLAYTQWFDIDRWGNRQINAANTTDTINEKQFQITTTNNRLKAPTDTGAGTDKMRYDAAGNLEWDEYTDPNTQGKWRGYDAAGRIAVLKTSETAPTELARYIYDASGKRVRSFVNGVEKWFVYGIGGELIAEYTPTANQSSPSKEYGYRGGEILIATETVPSFTIRWMLYDLLGSARIITDLSGSLATIERHDYLPYGEEIAPTVGQRNQGWQGYGVNTQRKKFTGYERDDESGLDFAQARYYANIQGRFTSPDPLLSSAIVTDPQSWNRYIYVGNRPTTLTDPDGLKWFYNTNTGVFQWFYSNTLSPDDIAKGWVDIGNRPIIYTSAAGSLIYLDPNQQTWRNLTAEAADLRRIYNNDKARADAERFVNAIILDFIGTSLETGVTLGTGGAAITFRVVAKEVLADEVKGFVGKKISEAVCFTAGTPIKTLNGDKPIEEIKPGDLVLSYNLESGALEYKQVVRTFIRESENLYDLFIQGEDKALRVTANHPFFARPGCPSIETEGQWVRVDELHSGLDVLRPDGEWVRVVKLQRVKGKFTVFNFEVADNHDYFVGKYGILVHNANYGTPVQAGDSGAYGDLTGIKGDGLTPHHMPQAARGFTSYEEGGAIVLPHGEHVQTRTYGGRGAATLAAEQGLDFRTTLARDIRDIRKIAGSRYNKGLLNLTDYYRKNFPALINKPKKD